MAERITLLLNNTTVARAMGDKARKRVEEKFSCQAQLESGEGLYDRLLARSRFRAPQVLSGATQ
jgi:hypothetical protein